MANNNFISSSSFTLLIHRLWKDESKWIQRITKGLENSIPIDTTNLHPCIFTVPKTLADMKPEAFFPQKLGLGPYHHFTTHLYYLMERRKCNAVQTLFSPTNQVLNSNHPLILKFTEYDDLVRAFYKEPCLDLKPEVLAWVLVIDTFFLLHQFRIFHRKSLGYDQVTELVKDIIMVENQIPLALLWTIYRFIQPSYDDDEHKEEEFPNHDLKIQIKHLFDFQGELQLGIRSRGFAVEQNVDNFLYETLLTFCNENSPFKLANLFPYLWYTKSDHLLDFMYKLIVCDDMPERRGPMGRIGHAILYDGEGSESNEGFYIPYVQLLRTIMEIQNIYKFVTNIPWKVITGLIRKVYKSGDDKGLNEKIEMIPSASKLCQIGGLKFELTKWHVDGGDHTGCIKDICFDDNDLTFHLPLLMLNDNSEVTLRNLVVHEELLDVHQRPIRIIDYVHLMHGLVRNKEDVKVLREAEIIDDSLSDDKIVELFGGVSKSIGNVGRDSYLKKTIDCVNKHFNSRPRVKAGRYTKKCLETTWKLVLFVVCVITILQLICKAFCGVYDCDNIFHHKKDHALAAISLKMFSVQ